MEGTIDMGGRCLTPGFLQESAFFFGRTGAKERLQCRSNEESSRKESRWTDEGAGLVLDEDRI